MKHFKLTIFLTVLMSMVGIQTFADVWVDGICYNLSGNNATVKKGDVQQGGKIVIPSSVVVVTTALIPVAFPAGIVISSVDDSISSL